MNKQEIKGIVKVGVILFLITAISAGLLAGVNRLTAPIIEKNETAKRNDAMKRVMPSAANFELVEFSDESLAVSEVYKADNNGYVVMAEPKGYGGTISLVVGVSEDLTVTGVDITTQSETPGLGANCTKQEFKDQFRGKALGVKVTKNGAEGNEIDALSSSTVTSKAVTKGVNDALEAVKKVKEG